MSSEDFWYYFKTLLSKTGYLKNEDAYRAYISAYYFYVSNDELESWDKFDEICRKKGYIPNSWVKYIFNTLLENKENLEGTFSELFKRAVDEKRIKI